MSHPSRGPVRACPALRPWKKRLNGAEVTQHGRQVEASREHHRGRQSQMVGPRMTGTVATEVYDYARMNGRPAFRARWVNGGSGSDQNHWMELTSKVPPGEFSHWRPRDREGTQSPDRPLLARSQASDHIQPATNVE